MKVSVTEWKGRVRIRWRYQGKDYDLWPGLPYNKQNKGLCEAIANRIQADCLLGQFDKTLGRYNPQLVGHNHQIQLIPELFDKFTEAMKRNGTIGDGSLSRYRSALSHLAKRLDIEAQDLTDKRVRDFVCVLSEHCEDRTVREYLALYRRCFEWAQGQYQVPEENPWVLVIARHSVAPKQGVQPFTPDEIKAILGAMRGSKDYRHYADFTAFLLGVGCRPGEAIALQWKHIDRSFKTVWIGQSFSGDKVKATKTGKARTVHCSESVQKLLRDRHSTLKPNRNDLVFPAKDGGHIDIRNYRNRAWKRTLDACSIEYRKPYAMRHTAVSLALEAGADPVRVADQCGHRLDTMLGTYAHVVQPKSVFVDL